MSGGGKRTGVQIWMVLLVLVVSSSLYGCSGTNVSVVISPPDTLVNGSATVLMVCVAHGDPSPAVNWERGGNRITNCTSERHNIYERAITTPFNNTFVESVLEICGADAEDSGDYLCTASNGVSSASASNASNLTVIPEPSDIAIVVTTPSDTLRVGSTVLLVCVAFGDPIAPEVRWQFNGSSVITNSTSCRHTIHERKIVTQGRFMFVESILEICDVGLEDTGEYLCTASHGSTTVYATNATMISVLKNEVPSQPDNCLSVPVYDSNGDLTAINFTWSPVETPEPGLPRATVDLNVTQYTVSVDGLGTHTIPADYACPGGDEANTCSYSFAVQLSRLPQSQTGQLRGQIAAESEAGRGPACNCSPLTTQLNGDAQSNRFLSLTTDGSMVMLECTQQGSADGQTRECEFCYGSDPSSCQPHQQAANSGSPLTCVRVPLGGRTNLNLSPVNTDATYCYRATANVDGNPTAAIVDTFTVCSCTGTDGSNSVAGQSTSNLLPITVAASSVVALLVGLILGFLIGACSLHRYHRGKEPSRLLSSPRDLHSTSKEVIINAATTIDGEPMYEDMDTLQRKQMAVGEFELTMTSNDAYAVADPVVAEDLYDND